ncbi:hypothetical protein Cni_G22251 [Canna indica]|uniref:Uncharacterized protein n=1 Tax=Canna indica TaxID=4628 RepID=A0AAQ3KWF4_9LILI|nr:hypothetical protein Cni_G22251 [Canna indica]
MGAGIFPFKDGAVLAPQDPFQQFTTAVLQRGEAISPNLTILRSILCNEVILHIVLRRGLVLLTTDGTKLLLPRIEALRSYDATEAVISTLFRAHP